MPDNGVIGAMVIAVAGAVTAAGSAIKGITDVKSTKDLLEIIAGDDGKGGLLAKLTKRVDEAFQRIEEIAKLVDPELRTDLDNLVEKVRTYRAEQKARAAAHGQPVMQTGSFPTVESLSAISLRLDDVMQRLKAAEERSQRNEERLGKHEDRLGGLDAFVGGARETLATIKAHMEHLLRGKV